MAGYSSKNIIDKLGVKSGMQAVVMRAPEDYAEVLARSEEQLEAVMGNLAAHIVPNGMVWVSWAKRSSPLNTGLDDNKVRRIGLDAGLVDVKVAAVSEDWSGMKFVRRLADR
jgi:hypothetical protein